MPILPRHIHNRTFSLRINRTNMFIQYKHIVSLIHMSVFIGKTNVFLTIQYRIFRIFADYLCPVYKLLISASSFSLIISQCSFFTISVKILTDTRSIFNLLKRHHTGVSVITFFSPGLYYQFYCIVRHKIIRINTGI